jgi:hypothetical protein
VCTPKEHEVIAGSLFERTTIIQEIDRTLAESKVPKARQRWLTAEKEMFIT